MLLLCALLHAPHRAVTLSLLSDFSLAVVASRPRSISAIPEYVILEGSSLARTKTLGPTRCITALHAAGGWFGRESSVIIDRRLPVRASGSSSPTTAARATVLVTSVCADEAEGKHGVLNPRLSYPRALSYEHHTHAIIHTDSVILRLRVPAWRPGRVRQVPILRASFWRGLYFAVQIHLRSLSDSNIHIGLF
jgi:hypothetical protein